jgi:Ca2+-binding RTX toxin-like protein
MLDGDWSSDVCSSDLGSAAINGKGNAIANIITGNGAANMLYADNVVGDSTGGDDQLIGGGGNDTLFSGDGTNTLDGGDGAADLADYSAFSTALTISFDTFTAEVIKTAGGYDLLSNVENVRGSSAGDAFNISIAGKFYGGAGDDIMGDSNDGDGLRGTLYGEAGNDELSAGTDGGVLDGGADDDTLWAYGPSTKKINMTGGTGADQFGLAVNADGTLSAPVEIKDFVDGTDHLVFQAVGSVDTAAEWFTLLTTANDVVDETDGLNIGSDAGSSALIMGLTEATFTVDDILMA